VTLPSQKYLAAIQRESEALAGAAEDNLGTQVPTCPEWSVADLVYHVGDVFWSWRQLVAERRQKGHTGEYAPRPADAEILAWFADETQQLVKTLSVDPATKVWTWSTDNTVGFVQRRMAQEILVHRADAEVARGAIGPADPALAADGIDEFLQWFLPEEAEALAGPGESIHLHATDTGDEWFVVLRDGSLTVTREHAKGDAAARAPVTDLLMLLWRRIPASAVDVVGDAEALDRFLARPALT
jgi:uncharacterized protein (TIGR03083 family)